MSKTSSYKDGEVVWVKWGTVWWPGEVWSNSRVPSDILTSLRKPVYAFVKFFQEELFEFVRSENHIAVYNCEKKMEYIKKGMDKFRSNNKVMTNFPADVVKAEQLTGGNSNILNTLETPTKSSFKSSLSNVSVSTSPDIQAKKVAQTVSSPGLSSKKSAGSYNSSVKVQNTTSSEQKANEKKLTCTMCNFSTDRMNLLMMHIKNHSLTILSRVNSPSSSEARKPIVPRSSSKRADADDGIAEDVRKIKESMKEMQQQQQTISTPSAPLPTKKTRTSAAVLSTTKSTPKVRSQASKREKKSNTVKEIEEPSVVTETETDDKSKIDTRGLKNELLADWLDDDEIGAVAKNEEELKSESKSPAVVIPSENLVPEKVGESSRSIRNIPKKQRVSEMYIQPEPENKTTTKAATEKSSESSNSDKIAVTPAVSSTTSEPVQEKKAQKAGKRKHALSDTINEPEKKKPNEDTTDDNKLLMATAELLNETEVPKTTNSVQSPSTFHKSNDIDKRYLPPKERNKRIFRAKNSPDVAVSQPTASPTATAAATITPVVEEPEKMSTDDNGIKEKHFDENESKSSANEDDVKVQYAPHVAVVLKTDRQELMLPHKKKQSSRLLTTTATEKQISPVRETRNIREPREIFKQEQNLANVKSSSKRSRKSNDSQSLVESNKSTVSKDLVAIEEAPTTTEPEPAPPLSIAQSPLRETEDVIESKTRAKSPSPIISQQSNLDSNVVPEESTESTKASTEIEMTEIRGQKRQRSKGSQNDLQSESKKFHKSDSPQPRSIVACASEAICITSKGTISVARRDSIKTTCANSVVVTSHVIISEATKQPIVTSQISTTDTTSSPIQSIATSVTISPQQQTPKNALKIPKENLEEMKKQGLVTVENNRTKLTPKGRQKFKEFQDEQSNVSQTSSVTSFCSSVTTTVSVTSVASTTKSIGDESQNEMEIDEKEEEDEDEDEEEETEDKNVENSSVQHQQQQSEEDSHEDISQSEPHVVKVDDAPEVAEATESKEDKPTEKEVCEQDENENETIQKEEKEEKAEENDEIIEKMSNDDENESKVECIEKTDTEIETASEDKQNDSTKPEEIDEKDKGNKEETESVASRPTENGNESNDVDTETPTEDANSGGAGLIALQAETFGGPPNCFYLCRPVEGGYEPVDNQILVLNAQNALVPYDGGEIATEAVQENLSAYSQLSPNSNIIINTPNGQKIELNHYTIMALQEQADENGIASVELSGEQLELNINGILEAIQAQQDTSETAETLGMSAVLVGDATALVDGATLIVDPSEIPVEIHHTPSVATQVSETLSKPIMSTTVAPEIAINNPSKPAIVESVSKNLNIEDSLASIGVKAQRANVPKSLELPITVTNPTIAETVNHRKLTSILGTEAAATESFVVQATTDNGSVDD